MNSAAGKEEDCDQGSGPVESERASGDPAQLVLEAFDEAVREPRLHVRDDPLEVLPDGPRCADEWSQSRAGRPGERVRERAARTSGLELVQGVAEGLVEEVRAIEALIRLLNGAQIPFLRSREVLGLLEDDEARALQLRPSFAHTMRRRSWSTTTVQ